MDRDDTSTESHAKPVTPKHSKILAQLLYNKQCNSSLFPWSKTGSYKHIKDTVWQSSSNLHHIIISRKLEK